MGIFSKTLAAAKASATETQRSIGEIPGYAERSRLLAPTGNFRIAPTADGKTPFGYQAAAIQTALIQRRIVAGHAPGLGKTLIALGAAALHIAHEATPERGARAVIIVPESTILDPWDVEIRKQHPGLRITHVSGYRPDKIDPQADVAIIGHTALHHRLDDVLAWDPTCVIVDEAQCFKNPKAQRTAALLKITDRNEHDIVIALTGTIAKNRPEDVWAVFRALGRKHAFALSGGATIHDFVDTWCETETVHIGGGRTVKRSLGLKRGKDLHEALRRCGYVRVERDEVHDLPSKLWVEHDLQGAGNAFKDYQRASADFLAWLRHNGGPEAALRASRAEAITRQNALLELAGLAKLKASVDYISHLVDQGEKVVVIAKNRSVVTGVADALQDSGITTDVVIGGQSNKAKLAAQDRFRYEGGQVIVANIKAAGVGLNLEQACHLVFVQGDWAPGDIEQASDRIYRVTQKRECTIHVLRLAGSIEIPVWDTIFAKSEVSDSVNSGQRSRLITKASTDSVVNQVTKTFFQTGL